MILSTISFIVLIGLICLTQITLSHKCVEFSEPIYRYETKLVDCPIVSSNDKRQLPAVTGKPASTQTTKSSADDMFVINFSCYVNDAALCNKAKNVFINAGKYITATINFKSVVTVDAQFLDFCANYGDCNTQGSVILGAAGPSRMIPYKGPTDDKTRLYPQALIKQMNIAEHPDYGPSEITAVFNSEMNYWFEGDPPMNETQVDMLYVVTHELNHGLGFIDSWNMYMNNVQALTPYIVGMSSTPSSSLGKRQTSLPSGTKGEFMELIFDKNLILLPTGQPLTFITDQLNNFSINLNLSDSQIISSFEQSPQFSLAQQMYNNSVTHGKIGFLLAPGIPPNTSLTQDQIQNNVFILETSLIPFQPGSSIGHADYQTYLHSADFLMLYTYPPGQTLDSMMSSSGSTNTTGPMGPKLRSTMGVLGYDIKQSYTPPVLTDVSSSTTSTTSNATSISFKFLLSLVCLILTFICI